MTRSKFWHQRGEAFAALGECGPKALPLLRQMLRDDSYDQYQVAPAIIVAAGDDAGREMTEVLQAEVAFWTKAAPTLPQGWWNSLNPEDQRRAYQNRYSLLLPALASIGELRYQPGRAAVQELHDLWVSCPQYDDKAGLNQITEACDKTLDKLGALR